MSFGAKRWSGCHWSNVRRTLPGRQRGRDRRWYDDQGLLGAAHGGPPVHVEHPDSTREFFGLHLVRERPRYGADAYWFGSRADNARYKLDQRADRRKHARRPRLLARPARAGALDGEIEVAYQFGDFGAADVSALLVASRPAGARRRPPGSTSVRLRQRRRQHGGRLGTFNQLYATGHSVLGTSTCTAGRNVVDLWGGANVVHRGPRLQVDLHNFWRASTRDASISWTGPRVARPATACHPTSNGARPDPAPPAAPEPAAAGRLQRVPAGPVPGAVGDVGKRCSSGTCSWVDLVAQGTRRKVQGSPFPLPLCVLPLATFPHPWSAAPIPTNLLPMKPLDIMSRIADLGRHVRRTHGRADA